MKFSTAIASFTVLVAVAPSVIVALPAGCWKNGQNRPTADGHAIALHMCQAVRAQAFSILSNCVDSLVGVSLPASIFRRHSPRTPCLRRARA
jgi:hypothetical protein